MKPIFGLAFIPIFLVACEGSEQDTTPLSVSHNRSTLKHIEVPPITKPHPRLTMTQADIDKMKERVAARQEPWYSQANLALKRAREATSHSISVYTGLSSKVFYNNVRDNGRAAWDLALGYHLSGDESMAQLAVDYLLAWASATPRPAELVSSKVEASSCSSKGMKCYREGDCNDDCQKHLTCGPVNTCLDGSCKNSGELRAENLGCFYRYSNLGADVSRGIFPFLLAYDLLYNSKHLTDEQRKLIEDWFKSLVAIIELSIKRWEINDYHFNKNVTDCHTYCNYHPAHTLGLAAIGYVVGDRALVQKAIDSGGTYKRDFRKLLPNMLYRPGDPVQCADNHPPPRTGEVVDRYRHSEGSGFHYTTLVMGLMTLIAEMAHNNGLDLYGTVTESNEQLSQMYDFYSSFFRTRSGGIAGGFYEGEDEEIEKEFERIGLLEVANRRYPTNQYVKFALDSVDRRTLKEPGKFNFDCWSKWTLTHGEVLESPVAAPLGEFSYDFNQWSGTNLSGFEYNSNTIYGSAVSGDPQIKRHDFEELVLHTNSYDKVQFRMRLSSGVTTDAELFWITSESENRFSNSRKISFDTTGKRDGNYHIYTASLESLSPKQWTGLLKAIRIDPMQDENEKFWIDWVRLVPKKNPSLGEFRGTFDGWVSRNISQYKNSTNMVSGESSNQDPQLYLNDFRDRNLLATRYASIQIRMRLDGDVTSNAELFWSTDEDNGFSGNQRIILDTVGKRDGNYHTFTISTQELPGWNGYLSDLRIDPMSSSADIGKSFAIDWVRLIRKSAIQ